MEDSRNSLKVSYYRGRYKMGSAEGRDTWGRVQEGSKGRDSAVELWAAIHPPPVRCDNAHEVLATRKLTRAPGVQSSYWGSITHCPCG